MTPDIAMVLRGFAHYKAGHLPSRGGWLDQSACYTEAMIFLSGRVSDFERKAMERGK